MRPMLFLALAAAWATAPAGAQSVIQLEGVGQRDGPNAQAAQRPLGPNARAAQRPVGPNGAIMRARKHREVAYYPSCAEAGVDRASPLRRGEPGYSRHLDRDGDGVACE